MSAFFSSVKATICMVLSFITAIFGCGFPERATKDLVPDDAVRIMSFNIRCGEIEQRYNIVPQLIGEYMPDSVGVQECTFDWFLTFKVFLPEYEFVGVGRDTGNKMPNCGEMSAVLYRKDKYKLVDSGTFWLSETPNEISYGWDAACRRICTWVVLENKETGEQYAHVNTHLDHEGNLARQYGSELVLEKVKSFSIPAVLTGDFNFKKGCDYYSNLITKGLVDTQDIADVTMNGKTYHGYKGGEEGKPIDYILTDGMPDEVKTYKIVRDMYGQQYSSDHYPIYADIVF